jgi:uncharacterized protein YuzE
MRDWKRRLTTGFATLQLFGLRPIMESEEVQPGVVLDFNADGKVVGVEILSLSLRVKPEQLNVLQYETV